MSVTVTYKGSTLTTAENQTRTLQTAGTWLQGDIIIMDVTTWADAVDGDLLAYGNETLPVANVGQADVAILTS